MAGSDRLAAAGTYAQQLLDNREVQSTARQAIDASRAAYRRARGQDARKAVQDRKLRRRVAAAVTAVGEFAGAATKPPPKPKSPWPRRIALLLVIGAGAWLASDEAVRARVRGLLNRANSDEQTSPPAAGESNAAEQKEA